MHPPISHIVMAKKTGDKSGFEEKSGCDKSEDTLLNQPVLTILI